MTLGRNRMAGEAAVIPPLSRYAAVTVAAVRAALGVSALLRPSALARPWVGPSADEPGARVLGRALGARDLALGLGALAAAGTAPAGARRAGAWFAAGALSDALDLAVTATAWRRLPPRTRWLVAVASGGAAAAGALGTLAALPE